jgi:hypothetical protein
LKTPIIQVNILMGIKIMFIGGSARHWSLIYQYLIFIPNQKNNFGRFSIYQGYVHPRRFILFYSDSPSFPSSSGEAGAVGEMLELIPCCLLPGVFWNRKANQQEAIISNLT